MPPIRRVPVRRVVILLTLLHMAALPAACSFSAHTRAGADAGPPEEGGTGGSTLPRPDQVLPCNPCQDFSPDPVVVTPPSGAPVPANVATLFGPPSATDATGGPCLIEPEDGSLLPRNWLRPRFRFKPGTGQTVFELRLHAEQETNDLVVYTTQTTWTMPAELWTALSRNVVDKPIKVTVRGLNPTATAPRPATGASATFSIAPVDAAGSIVYWTTSAGSAFKGFGVGEEGVVTVLTPSDTPGRCVGCHTSTPDGDFIGFSNSSQATTGDPAHIEIRSGQAPSQSPAFITPAARALMNRNLQELPAFTEAHWAAGDHLMLSMLNHEIVWTDLEATSQAEGAGWGVLARTGDTGQASNPNWSHSGATIAYTSAPALDTYSGILQNGDIYTVPYNARQGGNATALAGASDPAYNEFYPAFSPDDELLAFTRVRSTDGDSYNNRQAEILVVPAAGGTPIRIAANDPCKCLGQQSPGVTNSWAKWAPLVKYEGDAAYYWLVFSSTRGDTGKPQLYVAPIVKRGVEFSALATYPALYLWNQPANEGNHTPSWDMFRIPVVP